MEPTQITKFGNSLYLDGSSYLTTNFNNIFGNNDFTIDWWEYRISTSNKSFIFSTMKSSDGYGIAIVDYKNGSLFAYVDDTSNNRRISRGDFGPVTYEVWNHYALVKNGNNLIFYKNGTAVYTNSSYTYSIGNGDGVICLGSNWYSNERNYYFKGYIDEFRISNIARWTTNFTPPTSQYSKDDNTVVLLHF